MQPRRRKPIPFSLLMASLAVLLALPVNAQFDHPGYVSPRAKTDIKIDGKDISIAYYAPSMHGRKIMGDLVPFGEVWCTGANWATTITSDSALDIGGLHLAKGSYTIWTIPDQKEWTLIINKQTGQYHTDYDATQDLGRTKMDVKKLDDAVETFKIDLREKEPHQGVLALMWEHTEASIPFTLADTAQ
jgi:hypothetical protein